MVEFCLLTFPRFPLRKKEHKSYFGKNRTLDFRTSRCAAYLLDHSGDRAIKIQVRDDLIAFLHGDRKRWDGVAAFLFPGPGTPASGVRFRATSSDSGKVFELPQKKCFVVAL